MADDESTEELSAAAQLGTTVAHELNGALTAIFGGLQTMTEKMDLWADKPPQVERALQFIQRGAERAAFLADRLQMASGQHMPNAKPLSLAKFLSDLSEQFRAQCRAAVLVQLSLDPAMWDIEVDAEQLALALTSLLKNGEEAVEESGTIRIDAANVVVDPDQAGAEIVPGDYVRITVSDTGAGMSDAVLQHATDMGFTTKGAALGLGLCQVQHLARHSGGWLKINSTPGQGTRAVLGFPRYKAMVASAVSDAVQAGGHRSILLVEDDDDAREIIAEILEGLNYQVVAARNAREALGHIDGGAQLDLLLTDMGLPGMNGYELAQQALASRPNTPILFMSGHSRDSLSHAEPMGDINLIVKPMTKAALRERVEGLIGSARS